MSRWESIALSSVREEDVRDALASIGVPWEEASHVTATVSLASAVSESKGRPGVVGLPIATLIDLIVMPGLPDKMAVPLDGFPGPSVLRDGGPNAYRDAVRSWQQVVAGRRMRMSIEFDDHLRRHARERGVGDTAMRVLVDSRREVSRTFQSLSAAGVHPGELAPDDPVAAHAAALWAEIEMDMPALAAVREDLWIPLDEFAAQSTPYSVGLLHRIRGALDRAFGSTTGPRVLVHHGFHFFTPPQWALFQLLRNVPDVGQVFVVHDDGENPAFETWRRFFIAGWEMPRPLHVGPRGGVTQAAEALRLALEGEPVDGARLLGALRILECRSPSEFVRQLNHERAEAVEAGQTRPRPYAASAEAVERYVRRLGRISDAGLVDLAQLPVGAFLLAIHDCLRSAPGGGIEVVLRGDALVDIASSGLLGPMGPSAVVAADIGALHRALPFFRGCRDAEQWNERAKALHRLVVSEVDQLGPRVAGQSDVDRLAAASHNPLRLVPWGDLTAQEAEAVSGLVSATVDLARQIASHERVPLRRHVDFLRGRLQQGMSDLDADERREIEAKLDGFSVALDTEIDVDGLVDVVNILLGRKADFRLDEDDAVPGSPVNKLRNLDALGYARATHDIHLANLADGSFPSAVQAIGWPFRPEHLRNSADPVQTITVEILEARRDTSALSDLYLLWLALDGVEPGRRVTLSWISDLGGEPRNPSPMLSLLAVPPNPTPAIRQRAGGIDVEPVRSAGDSPADRSRPSPSDPLISPDALRIGAATLDPWAAASALACPRRFAIQWAIGPSAAFQATYQQAMLFGNALGFLVKRSLMTEAEAFRACTDLWRNFTVGERASSLAKRRVIPHSNSALPPWVLTLGGGANGKGPIDLAYQAARYMQSPEADVVAPPESTFLPLGPTNRKACDHCPVQPRCAAWVEPED
jgi:hypothetical protein